MDRHLFDLLVRYGGAVLFLAQMLGIFGLPIPDELLLTISGALVRRGTLNGMTTLAAAISGCIAGITLSYVLGRSVGASTVQRFAGSHAESLARAQGWFRRFGKWVLAFGYFVPGVRHVTAIAAGSTPLEYPVFATYAYPGAVLWSTTFLAVGYYAGSRWERAAAVARTHLAITAAVVALGLAIFVLVRAYRRRAATSERRA